MFRGMTLQDEAEAALDSLSVLSDEVRRSLYFHVRGAGAPITRDEAAELAGISRNLAAFHLEKLVAAELINVTQPRHARPRRPGRIPKRYVPADSGIELSLPPRRYQTMGAVLIEAVHSGGDTVLVAALAAARAVGKQLGATALDGARVGRLGVERALSLLRPILEQNGYEPELLREPSTELVLRNCPFHSLLSTDQALICALNCELIAGVVAGLGAEVLEARLEPRPDHCCVTVSGRTREEERKPQG